MRIKTQNMIYGGLLIAIGILLPQAFHMAGGNAAGGVFLPMHIPVLVGGFLLGPVYGLFIGAVLPALSYLITGMPPMLPVPRMLYMIFELAAYGFFSGLFYKKCSLHLYVSLVLAQLAGRVFFAAGILATGLLIHAQVPVIPTVAGSVVTGLPGIVIQLVLIGPVMFALKKGGVLDAAAGIGQK